MEVKEDKVDQFLELILRLFFGSQKSAGFIYNELLREVDSNIFYLIEDWESEGDLGADTAGDHVMGNHLGGDGARHGQVHHSDCQNNEGSLSQILTKFTHLSWIN